MLKRILFLLVALIAGMSGSAQVKYQGHVSAGYAGDIARSGVNHLNLETTHGVRVNPYFFGGLGVGLNYYYSQGTANGHFYGNVRGYLLDKPVSPFLSMDLGYGLWEGGGGVYTSPVVGVDWRVGKRHSMAFAVGIQTQRVGVEELGLKWTEKYLVMRLEFVF